MDGLLDIISVQIVGSKIENSGLGIGQQAQLPLESGVSGDEVLEGNEKGNELRE